jgi:hypothetical protein
MGVRGVPGEVPRPYYPPAPPPPPPLVEIPEVNAGALAQLTEMGFPEVRCRNALLMNRMSVQQAMEFLLDRGDDESLDTLISQETYSRIARVQGGAGRGFAMFSPPSPTGIPASDGTGGAGRGDFFSFGLPSPDAAGVF